MDGLLVVFFTAAVLEWVGEHRENQRLIYASKPVALLSLMVWVWVRMGAAGVRMTSLKPGLTWFVMGLGLCLLGDVFLMLPPERFFLPGLGSFLLGHVAYTVGFKPEFPPERAVLPGWILMVLVGLVSASITRRLIRGLRAGGRGRMVGPVVVYAVVISVMLYAALTTLLVFRWHYSAALLVSVGAVLFYVSDILNAWDRFVLKLPMGRVKIMMTYHLGQLGIAAGVVVHYLVRPET